MNKISVLNQLPVEYNRVRLEKILTDIQFQLNGISEGGITASYNALTAAPTTGTYTVSDFIRNSNAANGIFGWECIADGTPGTWQTITTTESTSRSDNPIINGEPLVDQANNGAIVTLTANGANSPQYSADMWTLNNGGTAPGLPTAQQFTNTTGTLPLPAGAKAYVRITRGAVQDAAPNINANYQFRYAVEGFNWARYSDGTSLALTRTLVFQVRSSLTGTFSGSFRNAGAARSYPFNYTILALGTWTIIAIQLVGDTTGTWATDNTVGCYLTFDLGSGATARGTAGNWVAGNYVGVTGSASLIAAANATDYLDFTLVDILEGSQSRPYPHLTIGDVLTQCKRYKRKQAFYIPVTASPASQIIDMRIVPVITGGGVGYSSTGTTADTIVHSQTTGATATLTLEASL